MALILVGLGVITALGRGPWTGINFGIATGIVLGVWFALLVFVVTPMRMWIGHSNGLAKLENSLIPKLQILGVKEEVTDNFGRGWGIVVRNAGTSAASGCSARIEELAFETPKDRQSLGLLATDRPLHWAGQESESYEIPGGQTAHLNVVYSQRVKDTSTSSQEKFVTLAYRGDSEFQPIKSLSGEEPILALINISSDSTLPQYVVCKIVPSLMTDLILQGVTGDSPFSIEWKGDRRKPLQECQIGVSALGVCI